MTRLYASHSDDLATTEKMIKDTLDKFETLVKDFKESIVKDGEFSNMDSYISDISECIYDLTYLYSEYMTFAQVCEDEYYAPDDWETEDD